ncbi:MAG: glycosyltransferase family 39 protein [Acutalibacteraceae bacterium]
MQINLTKKKFTIYAVNLINSVLAAFAYIYFQRNLLSEGRNLEPIFSTQRIIIFIGMSICIFLIFLICSLGENRRKFEVFIEKLGRHPIFTVVVLAAIFRTWYSSHYNPYTIYYDTGTYTDYNYNILLGETDIFRTPGYPYFLKLIHLITGNFENDVWFHQQVSIVQSVMSLASIVILYCAGRKLFNNKYVLSAAALIYGIAPSAFSWDFCTLTESLSLFITVVLIYLVFSYLAKPKMYKAIILGLYCFLMIMVRPTFIYLCAVLAVFFIARFIFCAKERKKAVAGLISVGVCISLIFGYCGLNLKNYDYFKISSVSNTVNNLFIVMINGWYINEDYPELSNHIDNSIRIYEDGNWISDIVEVVPEYFSYKEIDEYVTSCIDKHKDEYINYTIDKALGLMNVSVGTQYIVSPDEDDGFSDVSNVIMSITFPFTFLSCLCLVCLGLIFALIVLIVKKRICWQVIGLCAMIFSHIFVSVYGSMAEFERLCAMIIPVVILLTAYFFDYVISAFVKSKVFHFDDNNSSAIKIKNKTNLKESDL